MSIVGGRHVQFVQFSSIDDCITREEEKEKRKIEKSSFEIDNRIFIRGRTSRVVKLIQ